MALTSLNGHRASRPTPNATPVVNVLALVASFDPTSASQISLGTLPAGAIPLPVTSLGGATGGTNPTVIVGTSGDDNGFADELDADGVAVGGFGALTGVELAVDTEVFGKVGTSAATGGTSQVVVNYIMANSGA